MEFPQKTVIFIQFLQSWNALLRVFSQDLSEFDLSETLLEHIVRINPGMGVLSNFYPTLFLFKKCSSEFLMLTWVQ